jgi:hypothetical protein
MTRFTQQQIPPMTTRQVPKAPCPACQAHMAENAAASRQPEEEVKTAKQKKK